MDKLLRNFILLTLLALSISSVSTQDEAESETVPEEAAAAEVSEGGGEETEATATEAVAEADEAATDASASEPAPKEKTKGYNGYYDIPARDMAYLCRQMPEYKTKGKQPDITSRAPKDLNKSTYLRKEHKCWKMRWSPCEPKDLKKAKPCGWYQMEEAPEKEC